MRSCERVCVSMQVSSSDFLIQFNIYYYIYLYIIRLNAEQIIDFLVEQYLINNNYVLNSQFVNILLIKFSWDYVDCIQFDLDLNAFECWYLFPVTAVYH